MKIKNKRGNFDLKRREKQVENRFNCKLITM